MFRLRHFFMILGFLLFIIGVLSVVFILIGANFSYLAWIDKPGSPRGIIIRIMMIGGGLIMSYMALNPPAPEEEETNHVP
ncbi:MAG TPA: hypothetical protein VMZ69_03525 [Saprospiraceae bacterium]|nr:hypothetical protein [Saprospiraceae bacterium]